MRVFRKPNIELAISDDCRQADMRLSKDAMLFDEDDISALVQEANIDEKYLLKAETKTIGEFFPIAKVEKPKVENPFTIKPLFSKDFVEADELIAEVEIADKVEFLGDEDFFVKNNLDSLSLGKNTYLKERKIYASHNGSVVLKDEGATVDVVAKFQMDEDLKDLEDEHFFGDLAVRGDIYNSKLFISGDLVVSGSVRNTILEVEGNIHIEGIGLENCDFFALGSIHFNSVKNSYLASGNKITFLGKIETSEITARDQISGLTENSCIESSQVVAGKTLSCGVVGSQDNSTTIVQSSAVSYPKLRAHHLTRKLFGNSSEKEKKKIKLELVELSKEIKESQIGSYLEQNQKQNQITITKEVFPSVIVKINNISYCVDKKLNFSKFFLNRGVIQVLQGDETN